MKVLLTGASGYLGQHLIDELVRAGHTLCAAYGGLESFEAEYGGRCRVVKLDLAAAEQVARLIEDVQPDCVVNLAAISSPVGCDKDPERAMTINCPRALVEALPDSTTLCHLSTDQVFDGLAAPYVESSETAPVNTYGRSKLEFERLLSSALPTRSVCLRSSLILGGRTGGSCRKQSFLQFCDERLAAEGGADFFSDEYRSAVYVGDVVRLLAWFVAGGVARAPGIYNMGGPERLSRVDIALSVARWRGYPEERVKAVARSSLPPSSTASPPDIAMDSRRLAAVSGIAMTPLDEMVRASLADGTTTGTA